jgi:hypothetical protein
MPTALAIAASAAYSAVANDNANNAIKSARPAEIVAVTLSGRPALRASPSLRA